MHFFERSIDTLKNLTFAGARNSVKQVFYNSLNWYEIYDLVEFSMRDPHVTDRYEEYLNTVLQNNLAAYRWVGGRLSPSQMRNRSQP